MAKIKVTKEELKDLSLPEGYSVVREYTREDRIFQLQARLVAMLEPTKKELEDLGRLHSEYYAIRSEIERLQREGE